MNRRRQPAEPSLVTSKPAEPSHDLPRGEIILVALVMLLGIGIRCNFLSLASVEHFDEGVYASNLLFDASFNFQYPMRHLYAPPLLPALIEGVMILAGQVSNWAALLPSLIAGGVTLGVVWRFSRTCFTPSAAIATLCLTAFSDLHTMFCRAALTDAPLLLAFVGALFFLERAGRSRKMSDFVLAGVITGIAWWTKYNGWLPLLIALTAYAIALFLPSTDTIRTRTGIRKIFIGWWIAAGTAVLIWSPYLYSLQPLGGYKNVAANHRQYLVGLSGWLSSLEQQLGNLRLVDSGAASMSLGVALFLAWLVRRHVPGPANATPVRPFEIVPVAVASFTLALLGSILGTSIACLILATLLAGAHFYSIATQTGKRRSASLEHRHFAICWFFVLAAMTPLYTPFLRLVLPLFASCWILSGSALDRISQCLIESRRGRSEYATDTTRWVWSAGLGIAMVGWVTSVAGGPFPPLAWRDDRRGLERIALEIRTRTGSQSDSDVEETSPPFFYVYGEPALLFQLRAAGEPLASPVNFLPEEPVRHRNGALRTYFVTGLHASKEAPLQQSLSQAKDRLRLIESFDYEPSWLVLLDHYHPRDLTAKKTATVRLYEVQPREGADSARTK